MRRFFSLFFSHLIHKSNTVFFGSWFKPHWFPNSSFRKTFKKLQIKMKIMEVICSYLTHVGMTPLQSIKGHPFNMRNLAVLFTLSMFIAFITMYLIHDATSLIDYTDAISLVITVIAAVPNFISINWKMAEILRFADNLEHIVNTSKCYTFELNWLTFAVTHFNWLLFHRTHWSNIEHHLHANRWEN